MPTTPLNQFTTMPAQGAPNHEWQTYFNGIAAEQLNQLAPNPSQPPTTAENIPPNPFYNAVYHDLYMSQAPMGAEPPAPTPTPASYEEYVAALGMNRKKSGIEPMKDPSIIAKLFNHDSVTSGNDMIYKKALDEYIKKELPNASFAPMELPNCLIGVEVEVEGLPKEGFSAVNSGAYNWVYKEDGSLRSTNDTMPAEYVTPPIRAKYLEAHLIQLRNTLMTKAPKHKFSERTSIHVHVDIRNLTTEQLLTMIIVYMVVERILFKYIEQKGIKREDSIFCVPINDINMSGKSSGGGLDLASVMQNLPKGYNQVIKYLVDSWNNRKYTGFNLGPVPNLGTVEFRGMSGNIDVDYLVGWVNLLLCLKRYATEKSFDDVISIIKALNTTSKYGQFLESVFRTHMPKVNTYYELGPVLEVPIAAIKLAFASREKVNRHINSSIKDVSTALDSSFVKYLTTQGLIIKKYDKNSVIDLWQQFAEKKQTRSEYVRALNQWISYSGGSPLSNEYVNHLCSVHDEMVSLFSMAQGV